MSKYPHLQMEKSGSHNASSAINLFDDKTAEKKTAMVKGGVAGSTFLIGILSTFLPLSLLDLCFGSLLSLFVDERGNLRFNKLSNSEAKNKQINNNHNSSGAA